jgi:cellobiose epimerase
MFRIIRDRIVGPGGYMRLFFTPEWRPISYRDSSDQVRESHVSLDHVSFGHDLETAFLLLEASETLGMREDTATVRIARRLVDHSLSNGWDRRNGGIYYEGYYFPSSDTITIINDKKDWWVQAETLHVLLLMSKMFPGNGEYMKYFYSEWNYIRTYIIDRKNGGWYEGGIDNHPEYRGYLKGNEWKSTYHETRSMLNCLMLLNPHGFPDNRK